MLLLGGCEGRGFVLEPQMTGRGLEVTVRNQGEIPNTINWALWRQPCANAIGLSEVPVPQKNPPVRTPAIDPEAGGWFVFIQRSGCTPLKSFVAGQAPAGFTVEEPLKLRSGRYYRLFVVEERDDGMGEILVKAEPDGAGRIRLVRAT